MNAEIVAIGSELLLGQIVDTNSTWIAQRLAENGVNLFYKTTVGDNLGRMTGILSSALERADVVITTGGIGPTQDDLTREAVASVTNRKIVTDPQSLEEINQRFRRRGFILTKNNEKQATVPEGATVIRNPNGTAPAFLVEDPRGVIISVPGVPFEMKWLIENEIIPYLRQKFELEAGNPLQVAQGFRPRRKQRRPPHRPPHRRVQQPHGGRTRPPGAGRRANCRDGGGHGRRRTSSSSRLHWKRAGCWATTCLPRTTRRWRARWARFSSRADVQSHATRT